MGTVERVVLAFLKQSALVLGLIVLIAVLLLFSTPRMLMDSDHISNLVIQPVDETKNRYPIIVHHGILPFFTLHKFAKSLRQNGYAAYSTQLSAANTPAYRATELAAQIDIVLQSLGVSKVNIIAHSLGGLDARYLISSLGYQDKVASLTTYSTPHRGASIAELFYQKIPGFVFGMIDFYLATAVDGSTWGAVDSQNCMASLTPEYMQLEFNKNNKDRPEVFYQSWTGKAGYGTPKPYDPINYFYGPYIYKHEGLNDGVVSVYSAEWGEFHDPILVGHAAQIGRKSVFSPDWDYDPYAFYESIAEGLAKKGF